MYLKAFLICLVYNRKEFFKALFDRLFPISMLKSRWNNENLLGFIFPRSHYKKDSEPKQAYNTKKQADRACEAMKIRYNNSYSSYKCAYCKFYHIGKNKNK